MAKQAYVYSGTDWVPLASEVTNLSNYYTKGETDIITAPTGLKNVVPSSVAVGSGSGSASALGTVTFSGCSSLALNGIFSSTYDNYRIVVSNLTHSAGGVGINMRLRKNGTDNTSVSYIRQYIDANGSTIAAGRPGTDSIWLVLLPATTSVNGFSEMTIFNPNNATVATSISGGFPYNGTTLVMQPYYGIHNVTSSADFDGFNLIPNSGTMSGTISVYGYTN
jgi:hypothetical protein